MTGDLRSNVPRADTTAAVATSSSRHTRVDEMSSRSVQLSLRFDFVMTHSLRMMMRVGVVRRRKNSVPKSGITNVMTVAMKRRRPPSVSARLQGVFEQLQSRRSNTSGVAVMKMSIASPRLAGHVRDLIPERVRMHLRRPITAAALAAALCGGALAGCSYGSTGSDSSGRDLVSTATARESHSHASIPLPDRALLEAQPVPKLPVQGGRGPNETGRWRCGPHQARLRAAMLPSCRDDRAQTIGTAASIGRPNDQGCSAKPSRRLAPSAGRSSGIAPRRPPITDHIRCNRLRRPPTPAWHCAPRG